MDFERARRSGQCVYCINYDLIHDLEEKGINVLRLFRELAESGEILDAPWTSRPPARWTARLGSACLCGSSSPPRWPLT